MDNSKRNSGDYNSGYSNSGHSNSGDFNSGNRNSGHRNSGDFNSGDYNSGDYNSGYYNSGDYNSGYYNSGNYNSGNYNSGDYNSGYSNSGHSNSGDFNSGDFNSGDINSTNATVRLFNKDSGIEFYSEIHNKIKNIIYLNATQPTTWILTSSMSLDEKKSNPDYQHTGGYLKRNDVSKPNGKKLSELDEKFMRSLPNFDAEILLHCTGIDLTDKKVKIIFDGKEILISKEEAESIKNQLGCK